ncbi:hypothetical protein [Pseudaeromonas paramecii]|uniref:Uncharacterized protein n=1 Tax=Pseudaeromonas paramecii TaxID=2138166 RepID=A0ABP8PYG3_9GAMM
MNDATEQRSMTEGDAANHYYSEQYLELQKEPVLYAWEIDHAPPYAWSSSLLMGAVYWTIGLGFFIFDDRHVAGQLTLFFMVLGLISVFYCRCLTDPNQLYHYRMTAKGIYYSQQDNIPAMAYTIARGIGWLLILVSLIAMGLVGPLALAGAGAGAFLAFKITKMKPRIRHYGCIYKGSGEILFFGKVYGVEIMEIPASGGEYAVIFNQPKEYDKVLRDIIQALPQYKVIEAATRKEFGY